MSRRCAFRLALAALFLLPLVALPAPARAEAVRGRSGTAFVIHKDGYLATCEHVIQGATRVRVHVEGRELEATVVAADREKDLAVLKVRERGLTPLKLRETPGDLGQEVRAFGFPLTMELGEGLKVTRGTLSGIEAGANHSLMLDAPVNPGNSGGPLVNEHGEVLGVISAMLVTPSVTNVGFAAPVGQLEPLLRTARRSVDYTGGQPDEKPLTGPELVKKVAPSVALVIATFEGENLAQRIDAAPSKGEKGDKPGKRRKSAADTPTPAPAQRGGEVAWEITNGCDEELRIELEAPEKREIIVPAGKSQVVFLAPGEYAATVRLGAGIAPLRKVYSLRPNERLQTRFALGQ